MDPSLNETFAAPVCFRTGAERARAMAADIQLATADAEALSELMPVFVCGEESATLAFRHFAKTFAGSVQAADALRRISGDEDRHERLLQSIRRGLPRQTEQGRPVEELRHFFKAAADRHPGIHFTRIAALDSSVCGILAALRSSRSPVARDRAAGTIFAGIHRDEARHVSLSMPFVHALTTRSERQETAFEMQSRFVRLLMPSAAALDRLAIDPDRLFARLRTVPRFLVR
jgi:hypothetical protein